MMLHPAGQHDIALRGKGKAAGQFVDCLGGVFAEDAGVFIWVGAQEAQNNLPALFVGMGGKLAFKPRPTVHATVIDHEVVNCLLDAAQRRGRGSIIEVGIAQATTIQERRQDVQADKQVTVGRVGVVGSHHAPLGCGWGDMHAGLTPPRMDDGWRCARTFQYGKNVLKKVKLLAFSSEFVYTVEDCGEKWVKVERRWSPAFP
jgi:hypothetical protein